MAAAPIDAVEPLRWRGVVDTFRTLAVSGIPDAVVSNQNQTTISSNQSFIISKGV
jgi:hypothetical protein